jgi:hypothetical protein
MVNVSLPYLFILSYHFLPLTANALLKMGTAGLERDWSTYCSRFQQRFPIRGTVVSSNN